MRVGAAGEDVEPALDQRFREGVGVPADLLLIVAERFRRGDPEARGLGRDRVLERPSLHPREDCAVDGLRMILLAENEAGTRAGERLVRRRRDEVAVVDRVRLQTRRDETGEVRHVAEEERPDVVGDLPELRRVDCARIRRAAAHDQPRLALARLRENVVVVDHVRLPRDAVVRDRVEPAAEVDLQSMREMAAVRELQREDRVAGLERGHVHGHVRLSAGVRLHVRVLGAEELLGAVDRELLDLVHDLAAAVVPLTRISLRVFVRRRRADRLQHGGPGEVL